MKTDEIYNAWKEQKSQIEVGKGFSEEALPLTVTGWIAVSYKHLHPTPCTCHTLSQRRAGCAELREIKKRIGARIRIPWVVGGHASGVEIYAQATVLIDAITVERDPQRYKGRSRKGS